MNYTKTLYDCGAVISTNPGEPTFNHCPECGAEIEFCVVGCRKDVEREMGYYENVRSTFNVIISHEDK